MISIMVCISFFLIQVSLDSEQHFHHINPTASFENRNNNATEYRCVRFSINRFVFSSCILYHFILKGLKFVESAVLFSKIHKH